MLLDSLAQAIPSVNFDLCIIGAGAAGITLAREFVSSRHKVLLLESGGRGAEAETQALYESEVVGMAHSGIHSARVRAYGGTTNLWGGQSLRLEPTDFQERSWVPHSGWPLTPQVLDPYYERAEAVLQVGERFTYERLCRWLGFESPDLDPRKFHLAVSQWSRCPNFVTAYGDQLASATNVVVALHANVTSINTNDDGETVTGVEVKSLAGKSQRVRARCYVICCGAIETARLLLNSDQPDPRGVGNKYDLVGRYFMDHLHANLGHLRVINRKRLHDAFESFVVRRHLYSPKLILSDEQQSRLGLLHLLSEVIFEDPSDSALTVAKRAYAAINDRTAGFPAQLTMISFAIGSAIGSPLEIGRTAWRIFVRGRGAKATDCAVRVGVQCENAPYPDSRVSLSDSRDCLGTRRARLNWVVGELERNTIKEFAKLFAEEINNLGYASFNEPRGTS